MQTLPDLSELDHAQKDALIRLLWAQLQGMQATILQLQGRVQELEGRLALNSKNSSKPPCTDGLQKPQPKSLRSAGQRPTGGQKGHTGRTLCQTATPDTVVDHAPQATVCDACQCPLTSLVVQEKRQVFDIPVVSAQVTEHRVLQSVCTCGKVHTGVFPAEVGASVQYGSNALATMVYLNQHQMLPVARTAQLMRDTYGLALSEAAVIKAAVAASVKLAPVVVAIAGAIKTAPVVHADETGMRVNKALHWMHTAVTASLTFIARHTKRGQEAFEAIGILPAYRGTLIHDGWVPYRALACLHGLCNAHHLRELVYVHEQMRQAWAKDAFDVLLQAHEQVQSTGKPLVPHQIGHLRFVFEQILQQGDLANPRQSATGKRGRTKQSKALNLVDRLRLHADDVWRFATDVGVPFTNNMAEQAVRMPKVKQKISGCFRTEEGADVYCTIRSYLATLHKQGKNLFEALLQTFKTTPPMPAFG